MRICRAGWSTSWNQDCREKYQLPQICSWHHPYGRKQTETKEPQAGPRWFPAEHRRAGAVCAPREGTGQVGLRHCVHTTVLFVCSIPPPHRANELVSLKNQQTEEVKQREPPWKWSHTAHNIREGPKLFLIFLKAFLFLLFFSFFFFSNFFFC